MVRGTSPTLTTPTINSPTIATPIVSGLLTKRQASDASGQGTRQYRSNNTTYTETYMSAAGIGIAANDALNWYTNATAAVVASLDRSGNFQVLAGIGCGGVGATFNGSTSGSTILKASAVASGTITLPAGTTDFSATGGASQVVKQTSAGGAFTVGQVAPSDLSGLGTGVATALGVNVGSAGAFVTFNGALGAPSSGTVTNLTGTASININGTVGATTPTTGVFTTVTSATYKASGKLTFQSNGTTFAGAISTGQQWMLNPNDVASATGSYVTVSKNTNAATQLSIGGAAKTNVPLHVVTTDASQGFVVVDNYGNGNGPSIVMRSGRGTAASPTATQSGDFLFNFYGQGMGSTTVAAQGAFFGATALETWTDSAQGAAWVYYTAAAGASAIAERVRIASGLMVGTTTDPGAGNIAAAGAILTKAPVTQTANSFTIGASDSSTICNGSATQTATLPAASSYSGRWLYIKNIAAQTVNSASSNIVPLAGGAAGTALLTNTAGKWASLQSDGTNWIIMAAN
jgi:hypothetical protein